jgi:hypothetical protein
MRSVFSLFAVLMFILSTQSAIAQRTPLFRDFPSGPVYVGPHSEPDLSSRDAYAYRTRLREAAREDVNFAGHYRVVTWGCGTSCAFGGVVDVVSGRVVLFPFSICCSVKIGEADFQPVLVRPNSRLIVFVGLRSEEGPDAAHFYEFTGKGFVYLASSSPFAPHAPMAAQEPRSVPLQEALPDYHPSAPANAGNQVTWKANGEISEAPKAENAAPETAPAPTTAPSVKPRIANAPTKGQGSDFGDMISTLFYLIVAVYFFPSIVAAWRGHLSAGSIILLNIVFGWTFIGWFLALLWAVSGNTRTNQRRQARIVASEAERRIQRLMSDLNAKEAALMEDRNRRV